ncbi:hypothetical protein BDD12DRAFT_837135 [Trichophaea hybrida]|nr:hypothetical protein BDD12DRAFT_837135 [Trichophaea hybrida]
MKQHTPTETDFWKIVGPAAVIMGFMVFLAVIYKKYGHRELVNAYTERRLPKEREPKLNRGRDSENEGNKGNGAKGGKGRVVNREAVEREEKRENEKGEDEKGEDEKGVDEKREDEKREDEKGEERGSEETDEKKRDSRATNLSGATTMMSSTAALSMTFSPSTQAATMFMSQEAAATTTSTSPVSSQPTTTSPTPPQPTTTRTMTQTTGISISRTPMPPMSHAVVSSAAAAAPVFTRAEPTALDDGREFLPPSRKQSAFGDWWTKYLRSDGQAESQSAV